MGYIGKNPGLYSNGVIDEINDVLASRDLNGLEWMLMERSYICDNIKLSVRFVLHSYQLVSYVPLISQNVSMNKGFKSFESGISNLSTFRAQFFNIRLENGLEPKIITLLSISISIT